MRQLFYKFPVIKQIHALHLLVEEVQKEIEKQDKQIEELKRNNVHLQQISNRLQEENVYLQQISNQLQEENICLQKKNGRLQEDHLKLKQICIELQSMYSKNEKKIERLEKEKVEKEYLDQILKQKECKWKNKLRYDFFRGLPENKYKDAICDFYYEYKQKCLNLDNPKTFNEKIQWLKLYDVAPLKTRLADKVSVREWIKEKIGGQYLIPCLGIWDSFDEIDFRVLPERFVLKTNHGSGWNVVVEDKNNFDCDSARKKFQEWMGINFAWNGLELHYKDIPHKIYAEEYLENDDGNLYDYRFLCFNGQIRFVWVDSQSGCQSKHRRTVYDIDWNEQNVKVDYPRNEKKIEKPVLYEEMKCIVKELCKGFLFVRIDLYCTKQKIYFGEMTFTSKNGLHNFEPEEYDLELGSMMTLPEMRECENKVL